jgi:hypothetical protein
MRNLWLKKAGFSKWQAGKLLDKLFEQKDLKKELK